eukprot:1191526-Amphidinium_carterae.1
MSLFSSALFFPKATLAKGFAPKASMHLISLLKGGCSQALCLCKAGLLGVIMREDCINKIRLSRGF